MGLLDQRVMGDFPVSFSTAEAAKALAPLKLEQKADWLVNLRTLFRNMVDSISTEDQAKLNHHECAFVLLQDIGALIEYAEQNLPKINLRIYYPTYSSMLRVYPHAAHKVIKSDIQKRYAKLEKDTIERVLSRMHEMKCFEKTDCKLPAITNDGFITTHYPADLLTRNGFGELTLVESRTGALKTRKDWSTKITGGDRPEIQNLPFNKMTLQVFGDQSTQFASSPHKMKQMVLELASKSKWNTLTPDERVLFGISTLKDPFARRFLRDMFH